MPNQREQDLTLRKAEQAFLDVLQVDGYNDKSIRNVCDRALTSCQIRISVLGIRPSHSIPEDAEGRGIYGK